MQHDVSDGRTERPRGLLRRRALVLLILLSSLPGCVTPWEKSALMKDTYPNIEKVQGPTERRMRGMFWKRRMESADESDSLKPLAGTDEYLEATELYNNEQYAEAQASFKKVAKKYKKSEIREDALFMQAESAFQQEHYSKSHDLYAVLLKEYPSTRHLDVVSERLFKIGRIWLDFPEVAKLNEIQQINFEDPKHRLPPEEPPKVSKTPIFVPNFRDKTRPTFDTAGNGVAALQAIWMNDPTGPLADDAMMLVASHHARKGNYVEADRYFRMLRETFPNSPHLQDAFLLGSHVKLMSYQGADYDGKSLNDAQMLKESTLRLYPNIADAERLRIELAKIEDAKAEREWRQVEFWLHKKNKRAASIMAHQLIAHFPKSAQAEKAREQLEIMGPEYVSGAVVLTPVDPKKPPLWQRIIPGTQPKTQQAPPTSPPAAAEENASPKPEQKPPRWLPQSPFRKRPETTPGNPADPAENPSDSDHPAEDPGSSNQVASGTKPEEKSSSKKRSRGFWPAPKRLPDDADSGATKLDASGESGRTKL